MRTLEARAVITALDKTGHVFDRVSQKIRKMNGEAQELNRRQAAIARGSAAVSRAGTGGRVLGTAVAGYGAAESYKRFADAELNVKRIGLTANASDEQIAGLQKTLRALAGEAATPFNEVVEGLAKIVAGGVDLEKAMQALPAVVKTARAAGAAVSDISDTSLALTQNFGISADAMQSAFDVLVAGGKAGKFELKDMARYMASIAPAAAAAGMKGEQGLKQVVAILQTVRAGTGTSEEAASSVNNIFAKMESEETAKRFKKFGVDLRAEMKKARAEGKNLVDVFVGLTEKATKGDLSKIPQVFSDMEFARGMRALLSFKKVYADVMGELDKSAGSGMKDFNRTMDTADAKLKKFANSWDALLASGGSLMDKLGISEDLTALAEKLDKIGEFFEKFGGGKDGDKTRGGDLMGRIVSNLLGNTPMKAAERDVTVARRELEGAEVTARMNPRLKDGVERARQKLRDAEDRRDNLKIRQYGIDLFPNEAMPLIGFDDLPGGTKSRGGAVPLPRPRPGPNILDDVTQAIEAERARRAASSTAPETSGGEITVRAQIEVKTEAGFWSKVTSTVDGIIGRFRVSGAPTTGTSGSTGKSMPEVGQAP